MRTLPLLLLLVGCAPAVVAHSVPPSDPALLSAWELFEDGATQVPAADVVPFLPNAPAISDHADKNRFVRIPPGTVIEVDGAGRWVFPVGTVIAKTFGFDGRVVETRIMARLEDGWTPYVYLWNEDETDAIRITEGADVPVTSIGGRYDPIVTA